MHAFLYSDNENETPLHLACYTGCTRTVQLLIENNPTIVNHENRVGETPVMFAALNGQTETLKLLLNNNANLWANSHGNSVEKRKTCLDWAVINKRTDTVKAILERDNWKEVGSSALSYSRCWLTTAIIRVRRDLPRSIGKEDAKGAPVSLSNAFSTTISAEFRPVYRILLCV